MTTISISDRIASAEADVNELTQALFQVRKDGKEAFILSNSATANYRDKQASKALAAAKEAEMYGLKDELLEAERVLGALNREQIVANMAAMPMPTDHVRATAIALTSGLNGVLRSIHFLSDRIGKLEDRVASQKARSQTINDAYKTPEEQLEEACAEMEGLQLWHDYLRPETEAACNELPETGFWQPSIQTDQRRTGSPVNNSTPFD